MKIQCDVCGKEEAALFCCADEAALCEPCDGRVHRANKLASKHRRFSSPPSPPAHPLCDVCQERLGFVFCQEDRAILCRDCDASIHSANHLTMKHNSNQDKALAADASVLGSSITTSATAAADGQTTSNSGTGSGSSISDYLIKMCPGWRVEDLLVDDTVGAATTAVVGDCFSKQPTVDELLPFVEADQERGGLEMVAEEFPIWVPRVPQIMPLDLPAVPGGSADHYQPWVAAKDPNSTHQHEGAKAVGRERWSDDAFTVPQIAPASSNLAERSMQHSVWYF